MDKWEYPKIQDVDNEAFILIRQQLYTLLFELHMAENHKIVEPEKEYNVYWENFCSYVEYLPQRVDEATNRSLVDSNSASLPSSEERETQ